MSGSAAPAVMVTGLGNRLGHDLVRVLHRQRRVMGVDHRTFPDRPKDVDYVQVDIRSSKVRDLFRRAEIEAVVHLGVTHDPRDQHGEDHHAWNVLGLQRLLDCVRQFAVPKLVVVSSAAVYGPRADNPQLLTEDAPLLGASRSGLTRDLVTLDLLAQSFSGKCDGTETVILRPAHVLGMVRNPASDYLRLKLVPTLLGFDPMVQPVHQADVVGAICLALRSGVRGVFNIAGPAAVALSQVLRLLNRATLPIPHPLAEIGLERLRRWRVSAFSAPELDSIRYDCMVDDSRARRTLNYRPAYDLEQTVMAVDAERWV